MSSVTGRHVRLIAKVALGSRLAILLLLFVSNALLPSLDKSALLVLPPKSILEPLLRWDTLHFVSIAKSGYALEKNYAFQPGLPFVMRWGAHFLASDSSDVVERYVLVGSIGALASSVIANILLYFLTLKLSNNDHNLSLIAALLYSLPTSPATTVVAYTEPYFAFFSFLAMLLFSHSYYMPAALSWGIASSFRGLGIVNAGFFVWQCLSLLRTRFIKNQLISISTIFVILQHAICSLLVVLPFVVFQYEAFVRYCNVEEHLKRPWCANLIPSIYSFVQSYYWNVGFLKYWTLLQLPNFLIAAPLLCLSFAASWSYYSAFSFTDYFFVPRNQMVAKRNHTTVHKDNKKSDDGNDKASQLTPFSNLDIMPYIHLHTILSLLLLFNSHVQIITRQVSTNPVVFWYAATLVRASFSSPSSSTYDWGSLWLRYLIVWGFVATVLFAGFYPPA